MRFKDVYLFETPIAYDDETEAKVGTIDKETNTKWEKAPDANLTIPQLNNWFKEAVNRGILKDEQLGKGATKICRFNENLKTVFKYNHNLERYGNQIANEINAYKKYHSKFQSILPKFYKWGKHWVIQEYVKDVKGNPSEFQKVTGLPYVVWSDASYELYSFQQDFDNIPTKQVKSIREEIEKFVNRNYEKGSYDEKVISRILANKNLYEIIEFCFKTKVSLNDMHQGNLGISPDKKVKVIDFGVRSDQ